ncbi:hypothetical protein C6Q09_19390 [Burkholderia multivorans]|uniref:hypothetical protein n=1 Tax=Burkholderia multivorans TaxID=87883 RepID=UPI000CFEA78B|nr:hypothetical protein [Burkholderia multivorans]PRF67840.1 hypothetical protein C6Q09_19390 [Burkholderia multivorans]HDR9188573.1 hypothetical protein [Burkholderia vietnamiensis]
MKLNPFLVLIVGVLIGFPSCWKLIPAVVFLEWALFHFYSTELFLKLMNFLNEIQKELEEIEREKQAKKQSKVK